MIYLNTMWYDSIPTGSIVKLNSKYYHYHGCLVGEGGDITMYGFIKKNLTPEQIANDDIECGLRERPSFTIIDGIVKLTYEDDYDEEDDEILLDNPIIVKRTNNEIMDLKTIEFEDLIPLAEQNAKLYGDMNGNGIDEIIECSELDHSELSNVSVKQHIEWLIDNDVVYEDGGLCGFLSGDLVYVSKSDYNI